MTDTLVAEAQRAQSAASDPHMNVFVSANAGSGKTKVLVDRVIRLLLAGAQPDAIVCITYTKAAAAEMRARLFAQLGAWTIAPDDRLAAAVAGLTGGEEPADLSQARRLFARALETPGGLRIQTIHAFCERVLRRFPIEAGAPPGFDVLDEAQARVLAEEAMGGVCAQAVQDVDGPLATAFEVLTAKGVEAVTQAQQFALTHRGWFATTASQAGGLEEGVAHARTQLAAKLGVAEDADPDAIARSAWRGVDQSAARQTAHALNTGGAEDQKKAAAIAAALSAEDAEAALAHYRGVFFTQKGGRVSRLGGKGVRAAHACLGPHLDREADRLDSVEGQIKGARTLRLSCAGMTVGAAFLTQYGEAKRGRGVLDFADLVDKTSALLSSSSAAAWVLYKLDGGVSHVLVDEAQDTSPDQWTLVNALTSEFFAGAGARAQADEAGATLARTLFAVGDEKQSIYGFQGAAPAEFLKAGQALSTTAPSRYRGVALPVSFRSAPAILHAVDGVFSQPGVVDRLTPLGDAPRHQAQRTDCSGRVEVWPLVAKSPSDTPDDPWSVSAATPEGEAVDAAPRASPDARVAEVIAQWVGAQIRDGALVSERTRAGWSTRPMRPGDVMILVRRRAAVFEHLIRALKAAGLPVAGADRMVLAEQTVVQDMLCAARVALLPEDDLALAELLKSPFLHPVSDPSPPLDDMALFDLAHGRQGRLWSALQATNDNRFTQARDFVRDLLARVSVESPFGFLAGLMDRASPSGETYAARLFARLGPDAEDPAREVLDRALAHTVAGAASLDQFVLEVLGDGGAVKRERSDTRDEIRVMTVHGAKGLEAPVVILPDAGVRAADQFPRQDKGLRSDVDTGIVWSPSKADDPPLAEAQRKAALEAGLAEDLRLLYVAMTRAQDTLIVCGGDGQGRGGDDSWHGRVTAGLIAAGAGVVATPLDDQVDAPEGLRLGEVAGADGSQPHADAGGSAKGAAAPAKAMDIPAWAREAAAPSGAMEAGTVRPHRVAASTLHTKGVDTDIAASPIGEGTPDRFRRGNLIHALLETLPELAREERRAAGRAWLLRQDVLTNEADRLVDETLRVIDDPAFAPVFGPGSRAEAPIFGSAPELGPGAVLDGRVDRLAVRDDGVWVVDYKTNRPPPTDPARVDPAYLAQLAAYRAVLRQVYPGARVRCALLWTFTATLMEIPETLLDAALPSA